jgi:hypothetical protein
MRTPRALSREETLLLEEIAIAADYWATLDKPDLTPMRRCHSLAFSILEILDTGLQDQYAVGTANGESRRK